MSHPGPARASALRAMGRWIPGSVPRSRRCRGILPSAGPAGRGSSVDRLVLAGSLGRVIHGWNCSWLPGCGRFRGDSEPVVRSVWTAFSAVVASLLALALSLLVLTGSTNAVPAHRFSLALQGCADMAPTWPVLMPHPCPPADSALRPARRRAPSPRLSLGSPPRHPPRRSSPTAPLSARSD